MNTSLVRSAQAGRTLITVIREIWINKFVQHFSCRKEIRSTASVCVLASCSLFIFCWLPLCCLSVWYKGGTSVGDTEESTGDELRQAQSVVALLLWEGNHAKGKSNHIREYITTITSELQQHKRKIAVLNMKSLELINLIKPDWFEEHVLGNLYNEVEHFNNESHEDKAEKPLLVHFILEKLSIMELLGPWLSTICALTSIKWRNVMFYTHIKWLKTFWLTSIKLHLQNVTAR